MLIATGAAIVVAMLSVIEALFPLSSALPRDDMRAGLERSGCPIAPAEAKIIGSEWLSRDLQIVEVSCWQGAENSGSILFAVPAVPKAKARLIDIEEWNKGRLVSMHRVAAPAFDRVTRTLNSTYRTGGQGDCGTMKEWQWDGWSFRLTHVWRKDVCDGEGFEWDNRERWQVYPAPAAQPDEAPAGAAGPSLAKCPSRCSHHNSTRLGSAVNVLSPKNQAQPVDSAMKPAPDDK
jgi:hypothetical protein